VTGHIYPRFLGVDESGDFAWELANGRWTWGDDPHDANGNDHTFTVDRYLGKYGPIQPFGTQYQREPEFEPALISREALDAAVAEAFEDGKRRGAESADAALKKMRVVLDDWIQGARENCEADQHRGEPKNQACGAQFTPADIRRMIDDVAREIGLKISDPPEEKR
jgi:hypothetical protein